MSQDMGTLRLLDVRTTWAHEAADFTPWLADEDNIEHLGDALLQAVYRRVFSVNVVADFGLGHGLAHARRRPGHRVATNVSFGPRADIREICYRVDSRAVLH